MGGPEEGPKEEEEGVPENKNTMTNLALSPPLLPLLRTRSSWAPTTRPRRRRRRRPSFFSTPTPCFLYIYIYRLLSSSSPPRPAAFLPARSLAEQLRAWPSFFSLWLSTQFFLLSLSRARSLKKKKKT